MTPAPTLSTDAFLAAVRGAGDDAERAAAALAPFVPDPPTPEADAAVLGPPSSGRTAELFSPAIAPLACLACLYVAV